jgi:nitroreductase
MIASPPILDDLETVLTTTRAIRRRLDFDRPVARETIAECLQLALQAPTGGNAEDWRFVAIDDAEVRAEVAALYRECFDVYVRKPLEAAGHDAPEVQGRLGVSESTGRVLAGAAYLAANIHRAPWLVLACATRPNPEHNPFAAGTVAAVYGSVFPAVWSFCLALRARGLGSIITTLTQNRPDDLAAILGIPEGTTQCCLLPVAYTLGTDFKPAPRRPLDEVVFWNRWSSRG